MTCTDCTKVASTPCRVCSGPLQSLLCLGNQPPANAYHRPGDDTAMTHPLHRAVCRACGVEQVISRPDPDLLYQGYRYLSGANPRWIKHVGALAYAVTRERGRPGVAIDIGSNDGTLLAAYKGLGWEVWGVEPCKELAERATSLGVPTVNGFLNGEAADLLEGQADVIHAHNVWGHFSDPRDAARCMARMLKPDGTIIIETPWLAETVQGVEWDTLYHEHATTWPLRALVEVFDEADLWVVHADHLTIHGGSLRVVLGMADREADGTGADLLTQEADALSAGWPARFAESVGGFTQGVRGWLSSAHAAGIEVAAYGAAAKATVLLHALGADAIAALDYIVDDAPAKQGLCMPGTDLLIGPAARLLTDCPDVVLVTAWNWVDSIAESDVVKRYLSEGGLLVVPDPHSATSVRLVGSHVPAIG